MNFKKRILVLMLNLFFIACSEEENIEISREELMVNKTWTFKKLEIIDIQDSGGSLLTKAQIEKKINDFNSGNGETMFFRPDKTGYTTSIYGIEEYTWNINSDNQIELILENSNDNVVHNNFNVTNSRLSFEIPFAVYDSITSNEVLEVLAFGTTIWE
ncbi:hypothetical protein BSU00_12675 [Tenacibaculum sp. SG-28]|nr:hypothetical protein BSU00_12675 [Tenacibaculum sp. SG-28]